MKKNYQFKDLSSLSDEDKKIELVNFFDGIDVTDDNQKVAEYLYNYCKRNGYIYFYSAKCIIEHFKESDMTDSNVKTLFYVEKWANRCCHVQNNLILMKIYNVCKKAGLENEYHIKDFIMGTRYLYYYSMCDDGNRHYFDENSFEEMLDNLNTDDQVKYFSRNAKHMGLIQDTFRYMLKDNYPKNQVGLDTTIITCFRKIKEHQRLIDSEEVIQDITKPFHPHILNSLYGMAYLYEKVLQFVKEDEEYIPGKKRFADTFIDKLGVYYAETSKYHIHKYSSYDLKNVLEFLTSDSLGEEKLNNDELKEFLLNNYRLIFGVDVSKDCLSEKYKITQELIDYANTGAEDENKVKIKDLLVCTNDSHILYAPVETCREQVALLQGKNLESAYGDKDPLDESLYKHYIQAIEMKELLGDVQVEGVTPQKINELIKKNPLYCNNVRCSNMYMIIINFIDCLFSAFDLDDGNVYYTNDKIKKLNKVLGCDVRNLITIENLPYMTDTTTVVGMRKNDVEIVWYHLRKNVQILKNYYFTSDIVDMIKYHPEVMFSYSDKLYKYQKNNNVYDLYDGKNIDDNFLELVK